MTVQSYKVTGRFTVEGTCGHRTTLKYARKHGGKCKARAEPNNNASAEEQHARYIDCGPANWDDRYPTQHGHLLATY